MTNMPSSGDQQMLWICERASGFATMALDHVNPPSPLVISCSVAEEIPVADRAAIQRLYWGLYDTAPSS